MSVPPALIEMVPSMSSECAETVVKAPVSVVLVDAVETTRRNRRDRAKGCAGVAVKARDDVVDRGGAGPEAD